MIDDKQPMDLGIPHDTPIFRQPPLFVNARCRRSSQLGAGPCNCFPTQEFQEPIDQLRRPCRLHRSKEMVGSCEKNMGSDRLQWKKTHLTWCHMAKVVGPLVFIIALSICIHIYIYIYIIYIPPNFCRFPHNVTTSQAWEAAPRHSATIAPSGPAVAAARSHSGHSPGDVHLWVLPNVITGYIYGKSMVNHW